MRLSIAMCTYNGSLYLQEQLDSITAQSRLPDELIVCDDNSDDDTTNIIRRFASKAPFRVLLNVNDTNLGSTKNFERAINMCSGDIIFLCDQDDVWCTDKISRMEEIFLQKPTVGVVCTDAEIVDQNLHSMHYRLWQSIKLSRFQQKKVAQGKVINILLKRSVVTGATMAFRSRYNNRILPIPSEWVHDGWIVFLIAMEAELALINTPLIIYRQHPNNQIGGIKKDLSDMLQNNKGEILASINQYLLLVKKISSLPQSPHQRKILAQIEEKIHHLHTRSKLSGFFIRRLFLVTKELATLRYHRFSNGWRSSIKDLLF